MKLHYYKYSGQMESYEVTLITVAWCECRCVCAHTVRCIVKDEDVKTLCVSTFCRHEYVVRCQGRVDDSLPAGEFSKGATLSLIAQLNM